MARLYAFWPLITLAVVVALALLIQSSESKCSFQGIFNFGDSNSDTGGFWSVFPTCRSPNGMTYFHRPAGRASDGRLIIDFLAQAIGIPFLSPYLKSIGSDFTHGANYATLASTVRLPQSSLFVSGLSPFSLAIQLQQMKEFKALVDQQHEDVGQVIGSKLPKKDIFAKSIYTFFIGQNDFTGNLASLGIGGVEKYLPEVVYNITGAIKQLYHDVGGRTFWVLNLAPVGCYPSFLVQLPHNSSDIDQYGCLISYNKAVVDYNNFLHQALTQTRKDLPNDASVIYVDIHSVMLELFQHPTTYGLKYGTKACCGYGGGSYNFDPRVFCANTKVINGTSVTATACADPHYYVSWDGIHATEAANALAATAILSGRYFDPPFPLDKHCDLIFID